MAVRVVTAAALAAALFAPAAAGPQRHPWTIPHVLRYATTEDVVSLNPHLNPQVTLSFMSSLAMAWLVRFDRDNRPIPELATAVPSRANGGISADGRTITYHLRRDAKWSDGVPFTSKDVAFTVRVVLDPGNAESSHVGFDKIDRVETPDPYTVRFRLKQPWAAFYVNFFGSAYAQPCVLPEHLLGKEKSINQSAYNALPVGIGPFKYAEWKRGDQVVLVRDPLYFGRKPKLERVVFKIITDRNTNLTQLRTHEIDMWALVPAAYAARTAEIEGVKVLRQPSFLFSHYDFQTAHPPLDEIAVRRALRLATPRAEILEKIRHGIGTLQETPFPPGHPYHIDLPLVPYDPAAANRELEAAGWKMGPDGVRVKNGMRLTFTFASGTGLPDSDAEIELVRDAWKHIGATFEVRRYPSTLMFAPLASGGVIQNGKFDIVPFGWLTSPAGDLTNLYSCDRVPPNGQNDTRWCDRTADAAMARFDGSYDESVRRAATRTIQERLVAGVPMMVMYARQDVFAFNDDLHGFHPNHVTYFDDLTDADL